MKHILGIAALALLGYGAGSLLLNLINHTQTTAYLAGCIENGGDPIKCIQMATIYVNK